MATTHQRRRRAAGHADEVAFFNGLNKLPARCSSSSTTSGAPTGRTTTCGRLVVGIRHAILVFSRTPRNWAASTRTWSCRGRRGSRQGGLREQFVHVIDVVRRSSRPPASARRRWSTASGRSRSRARASPTRSTRATPGRRRGTDPVFEMMASGRCTTTAGSSPPRSTARHGRPSAGQPGSLNNQVLELYDLKRDFSQTDNVAAKYPQKVKQLKQKFVAEARKHRSSRWTPRWRRASSAAPNITAGAASSSTRER